MTGRIGDAILEAPEFSPAEVVCTDTSAPRPRTRGFAYFPRQASQFFQPGQKPLGASLVTRTSRRATGGDVHRQWWRGL